MKRILGNGWKCIPVILALPAVLCGQITYTSAFTRALDKAGIEYAEPVEEWLHVTIPPLHAFMDYDLVLQNDRNDFEVRYCIDKKYKESNVPAAIEVSRLLASIASNDEAHDIIVRIPPDDFLRETYNADRGMLASFTPKAEFSEKAFGVLLSLYAEGRSAIDIVILYQDPTYDPLTMYRNIRFRESGSEK